MMRRDCRENAHRAWIMIAVVLTSVGAMRSRGACLPLPSPDLQAIDRSDDHPDRTAADALVRLNAADGGGSALRQAELYSILAEARGEQGRPEDALAAIQTGLAKLAPLPTDAVTRRLQLRFQLLGDTLDVMLSQGSQAVESTDKILAALPGDPLERACTLAVRSVAFFHLNKTDRAVADGVAAYRLAIDNHWQTAHLEAASSLASVFERAGLFAQALQMSDEIVDIARGAGSTSLLSTVLYQRGQILMESHRYAEASAALEASRDLAIQLGDRVGAAAVDVSLCWSEIEQRNVSAADKSCHGGESVLAAAKRSDMLVTLRVLDAQLDLEHGNAAAALRKLDAAIAAPVREANPVLEPRVYRERARALAVLHRYPDAYADLQRAEKLDRDAHVEARNREVAVQSALVTSEKLLADNRVLSERLAGQRVDIAAQRQARRLWTSLCAAALLLCLMFAYLFWITRRHDKALRRQETILLTAGTIAPDALVLLDERRLVRFANRNLFGQGPKHPTGAPLEVGVPPAAQPVVLDVITRAVREGQPMRAGLSLQDGESGERSFELLAVPAFDRGSLVGVTLRSLDVTDVRRVERRVLDSASQERRRLSSDLHEGLGQELAGILLMLGSLSASIRKEHPEAGKLADQIAGYLSSTIGTTRELARGLSPVQVGCGSLEAALNALVAECRQSWNLDIAIECRLGGLSLAESVADHLYQISREAITHAAFHGRCTSLRLKMVVVGDTLELSVVDNGAAVNYSRQAGDGPGIEMVAYHARLLGGDLRLRPNPSGGTVLMVTVPLCALRVRASVEAGAEK